MIVHMQNHFAAVVKEDVLTAIQVFAVNLRFTWSFEILLTPSTLKPLNNPTNLHVREELTFLFLFPEKKMQIYHSSQTT